jgi:hypothetical protein
MLGRIRGAAFLLSVSLFAAIGLPFGGPPASAQTKFVASDPSSARSGAAARQQGRGWMDRLWGAGPKVRASKKRNAAAKAQAPKGAETAPPPPPPRGEKAGIRGRKDAARADRAGPRPRHVRIGDATGSVSGVSRLQALIGQTMVKGHVRQAGGIELKVGAVVPLTIHLRPLPASVVKLKPAWQGHEFFVSGNQVAIVQPTTSRIVELVRYAE